jgi:hypothetical protein
LWYFLLHINLSRSLSTHFYPRNLTVIKIEHYLTMSKPNESSLNRSGPVPPLNNCVMCLENLPAQNDYCKTSCGHEFHLSCMLSYTTKKGASSCSKFATSILCPLCREQLYNIPRDIDRELLRIVTLKKWSERRSLLAEGAKYSASIREEDYPNRNVGMMALHFAVRDAAPTEIIKEVYYSHPIALITPEINGFTPLDLLNGLIGSPHQLEKFGWNVECATKVKEFLEAQLPAGVGE